MKFGLDLPPQQRVYAGFFVYSFCMGSLPPRLPDLQRMMRIKEGLLGFGLIGVAAGTLVSLGLSGPILERIGYRRSILTLIPLLALLYAIASSRACSGSSPTWRSSSRPRSSCSIARLS